MSHLFSLQPDGFMGQVRCFCYHFWPDCSVRTSGLETKCKHPDVMNRVFILLKRSQKEMVITGADQSNAGNPVTKSVNRVEFPANSYNRGNPNRQRGHRQRVNSKNQSKL